jgi:cell division protein FtsB
MRKMAMLEEEVLEQARLLGMGSEREAALMGKVERLERENAKLNAAWNAKVQEITAERNKLAEQLKQLTSK